MGFQYRNPVRLIFGSGSLGELGGVLKDFKGRFFVATGGSSMRRAGALDRVIKAAKGNAFVFDGIESNPSAKTVDRGAGEYIANGCSGIIAIGGGSAIDCAKAIGAVVANPGADIRGFIRREKNPVKKVPLLITIPSTSGTSSEVNGYTVITDDDGIKKSFRSESIWPDYAIVDPELTLSLPREQTAITGMDVMAHAVESLLTKKTTPFTEPLALEAVRLAGGSLEKVCADPGNIALREKMSLANVLAGFAFCETGVTSLHAFSYFLTGKYGIAHGQAVGILASAGTELFMRGAKGQMEKTAKAMGIGVDKVPPRINEIMENCGLETRISGFGAKEKDRDEFIGFGLERVKGIDPVEINEVFMGKLFDRIL